MRPSWLLLFFLSAAVAAHAARPACGSNAQDPIATDRPQITSSSIVVPCGSLQFENGFAETGVSGQRSFDFPETSVRLGVAPKTELRIGVPDYFQNGQTETAFASGWGDMSLGFKQQLGPVRKFDLSIIPAVTLPTGARALSSHGYDPSIQLPWSRSLTKTWTAAGMFSVAWPTQGPRRNVTGQASLYFDRQLTGALDAYVEYSGSFPQRGGPQHILDFGAAYKLSPRQQLDIHCGFGLSAAAPDHILGFGYSVRFNFAYPRPAPPAAGPA